jgi:hypothetical protein
MKLLIPLFILLSLPAWASLSGEWHGLGSRETIDTKDSCGHMNIKFEYTSTSFSLVSGDYECKGQKESFRPLHFTRAGEDGMELYHNGIYAGVFFETFVSIALEDGDYNLKFHIDDDGRLILTELRNVPYGFIWLEGNLERKSK